MISSALAATSLWKLPHRGGISRSQSPGFCRAQNASIPVGTPQCQRALRMERETQWVEETILWPVFYPAPAFPGTLKILKNENCCDTPWFSKSQQPDVPALFKKSGVEQVGIAKSQGLFSSLLISFWGKKGDLGLCLGLATHLPGVIRLDLGRVAAGHGFLWGKRQPKFESGGCSGESWAKQNFLVEEENQPWWKKNREGFPDFKGCKWSR